MEMNKNLMVSHGGVTHPLYISEDCLECIKTMKEYNKAKIDGLFNITHHPLK